MRDLAVYTAAKTGQCHSSEQRRRWL